MTGVDTSTAEVHDGEKRPHAARPAAARPAGRYPRPFTAGKDNRAQPLTHLQNVSPPDRRALVPRTGAESETYAILLQNGTHMHYIGIR